MPLLLLVSLLWAFSFGLIKVSFADLPPSVLAFTRLAIALPLFLPFCITGWRSISLTAGDLLRLASIGALQYGVMYLCLFAAFAELSGYEVAVLTVTTPLYVVAAHGLLQRRWPPGWFWWTALLAIAGALLIFRPSALPAKLNGIALVQLSNICFAIGQVAYRNWRIRHPHTRDVMVFGWLYLGAVVVTGAVAATAHPLQAWQQLNANQWLALLYLGAVASGLGFFLWNAGAVKVRPATLAVFNNLKIPIAVLVSIMVFGEAAHLPTLLPGIAILVAAFWWAECRAGSATS
jgi:drug/metabolite transporter (DMT)-like permease